MNDTGNFQLVAENSQVKWESFKNPKDTLLPTQVMELEGVLSSRKRPENYSPGAYQFRLLRDGNAVLNRVNLPTGHAYKAYYVSGTNANTSYSGQRMIFDKSGYLYVQLQSRVKFNIIAPSDTVAFPAADYYHRITPSFHGILSLSYYPKRSQSANTSWINAKWCRKISAIMNSASQYLAGTIASALLQKIKHRFADAQMGILTLIPQTSTVAASRISLWCAIIMFGW